MHGYSHEPTGQLHRGNGPFLCFIRETLEEMDTCLAMIAEVTSSYFAGSIYIFSDPEINGYISQVLFSNNIKEESVDVILCFRRILT